MTVNREALFAKRDLYCHKYNHAKSKAGKRRWYAKLMEVEEALL